MRRAARALLAVALVLLASGCLRFRGELTIDDDATVTGTVIAAAKLSGDLPIDVTPPGGTGGGGGAVRTEPYSADGYVGTRVQLTRATFAEVERFFTDQGGSLVPSVPGLGTGTGRDQLVAQLRMRKEGGDVVVTGRFQFPDLASVAGTAEFEARLAIAFPGAVRDTTGSVTGRTVTWTFRPGQAQDVRARAALGGGGTAGWLLPAAIAVLTLGLLLAVAALFRFRATRRPDEPVGPHPPAPERWDGPGAPVPPGPGLSSPPTYGGS